MVVEAKDGQNNVATKTYSVTTTGTAKKYEYDANGNLRYEKLPNNTVVREYRWDQQNRLVRTIIGMTCFGKIARRRRHCSSVSACRCIAIFDHARRRDSVHSCNRSI